jgi:hypothetical protein
MGPAKTYKTAKQIRQSVACLLNNIHLISQSVWSNLCEIRILCRPAHLVEGPEDLGFSNVSMQAIEVWDRHHMISYCLSCGLYRGDERRSLQQTYWPDLCSKSREVR